MGKSTANLEITEQKTVLFYDDELTAVRADDSHVYVVLSHMCDALGVDAQGQARRIKRHNVLSRGLSWVDILSTQGENTQRRRARILRVDLVPLWLSGIRTSMVNDDIRPKLERFQEEAAAVLWEAFQEGRLNTDSRFEELLNQETETVQAYKMAMAIVKLAKQQILLDGRVGDAEIRLDNVEERLTTMEEQLSSQDVVTESQASQISQAVKAVAIALGKQTGRNEFGACYGEIYRRFNTTSYRLLPRKKFDEVMAFLTEWHQNVAGDAPF